MHTNFNIICCLDKNNGIGKNQELPWSLPTDYQFFLTMAKNCIRICGKNTFNETFSPNEKFYHHSVIVSESLSETRKDSDKVSFVRNLPDGLEKARSVASLNTNGSNASNVKGGPGLMYAQKPRSPDVQSEERLCSSVNRFF